MIRSPICLALLALSLGQPPVQAEDRLDALLAMSLAELQAAEESISTQTRQRLSRAPAVVSVITAETIAATGAGNLVEVLDAVPGLYIRANLFAFRPLVSLRGAAGTHTLIMVDGAPLKDLVWNTGIFWKGLPAHLIERIEIIRGPGSALYGADASAGVINVITKASRAEPADQFGLRLGSHDSRAAWWHRGGEWLGHQVGITAGVSRTDGHAPTIARHAQTGSGVADAPGQADYGWNELDLRLSLARGDWRVQADYRRQGELGIGLTGAAVLDPLTRASDQRTNLAVLYQNPAFAGDWGLNAEWRVQHLSYDSGAGFQERPPGFVCTLPSQCNGGTPGVYAAGLINQMRSAERRLSFEFSALYSGLAGHALRFGAGYVVQDLYRVEQRVNYGLGRDGVTPIPIGSGLVDLSDSGHAFAPEQARRTVYAFAQDVWTLSDTLELTAGLRHDQHSDFGSAWTPRLALVWQATPRLTGKLLYGEAFRAPSYLELYAPTAATRGNPELAPERSHTTELTLDWLPRANLRLGMNLYHFVQRDLIALVAGRYENRGELCTQGVEAEAQWQASPTLAFALNYSRHRYHDPTVPGFRVPERQAHARLDWNFRPAWHWHLHANRDGAHPLPAGATRAPIAARTLLHTTLRHRPARDWELALTLRNLLDVDAREPSSRALPDNLPLPGRSLWLQVRHDL